MGLDVTAYSNVHKVDSAAYDGDEGYRFVTAYPSSGFPDQADDVNGIYDYEGDSFSFRAGSYSGYNRFRESIAFLALGVSPKTIWENTEAYKNKPFFELINFSDCEGVIGPVTSAKLFQDFKDFEAEIEKKSIAGHGGASEWFMESYRNWMKAFEIAADSGFVKLH
jgi:hypothetical protein